MLEYVAIPLGSSSAAPVIRPGPRILRNFGIGEPGLEVETLLFLAAVERRRPCFASAKASESLGTLILPGFCSQNTSSVDA
jgi:hypothetical protein